MAPEDELRRARHIKASNYSGVRAPEREKDSGDELSDRIRRVIGPEGHYSGGGAPE